MRFILQMLEERMRSEASEKQFLERRRNEISAETSAVEQQAKKAAYEWQKECVHGIFTSINCTEGFIFLGFDIDMKQPRWKWRRKCAKSLLC